MIEQIVPQQDRQFTPAAPVDIPGGREDRVETVSIERHMLPRVPKQFGEVLPLAVPPLFGQRILAVEQPFVEFALELPVRQH